MKISNMLDGRSRALIVATGLLAAAPAALANTTNLNVNTTADTPDANIGDGVCADANGDCSLRAAIQEANAIGDDVRIRLQNNETYVLVIPGPGEDAAATGDLDITADDLEIRGRGSTVDASGLDRAFDVLGGASVEVRNLSVVNGAVIAENGGGWRNAGKLEMRNCSVSNSSATGPGASGGAIGNNGGDLSIRNTALDNNAATRAGGAIESVDGTTTIRRSTMTNNMCGPMPGNGGAFHQTGAGIIEVRSTQVENNTAASEGGGLWNSGSGDMLVRNCHILNNAANGTDAENGGGGLFNDGGIMEVNRCTIDGNTASMGSGSGGGVFNNGGDVIIDRTDITNNDCNRAGGGVEMRMGSTTIDRSTLNGNSTGDAPGNGGAFHMSAGGTADFSRCDVQDNTAAAEGGGLWNAGGGIMTVDRCDIIGNTASGNDADQGGGGLFNEGGEMIVLDSVIMNNVANGTSGSGGGVLNNVGSLTIDNTSMKMNTSNRAGGAVEANQGMTVITDSSMTSNSTGAAPGNGGGLHLSGAGTVEVTSTFVADNFASSEGGGLWNPGPGVMDIDECVIVNNEAAGDAADNGGGGVFNDGGEMTVSNSFIGGNTASGASGSGGGAFNNAGLLEISNTDIEGNDSNRAGGGIEARDGTTVVENSSLSFNDTGAAPGNGGGFHLTGAGLVDVINCDVLGNFASAEGGGLWNSGVGEMTVDGCLVLGNEAAGDDADQGGGGLFNDGGIMTVFDSAVRFNSATGASGSGGGVLNNDGDLLMEDCGVSFNASNRAGGGVEANVGLTTLNGVAMIGNITGDSPGNGGGLHLTGAGTVDIDECLVIFNAAANEGGGLWNSATGTMTVTDTFIFFNFAPDGPNVFNDGGTFTIDGNPVPAG